MNYHQHQKTPFPKKTPFQKPLCTVHRQNLQNSSSSSRQISSHPQIKREFHPSGTTTSSEEVFESNERNAAEALMTLKNPYNHVKIKKSTDAGIASETPNCSETPSSSGSPPNKNHNMIRVDKVVPVNLKKSSSLDVDALNRESLNRESLNLESLESAGFHLHYPTGDKRKIENSNSHPGFSSKNSRKNSTGKRPPKLDFNIQDERNQGETTHGEQMIEIPTSSIQQQILQLPENLVLTSPVNSNIFGTIPTGATTQIVHILNIPTPQLQLAGGHNAQFVLTNNNIGQQLSLSNNGMITVG